MPGSARGQWGWHRLADPFAEDLVRNAGITADDLVLDIGAGTGALTVPLAATGARVIAIELHAGRAAQLRERFGQSAGSRSDSGSSVKSNTGRQTSGGGRDERPAGPVHDYGNVKIVQANAVDLRLPRRPFLVVSNPPFAITTPLLRRMLHPASHLKGGLIVMQRAAARHWVGVHGRFALSIAYNLPRSAFVPRPMVDVAVLRITRMRRK